MLAALTSGISMDDIGAVESELRDFSSRFQKSIQEKNSALRLAKRQHNERLVQLEKEEQILRKQILAAQVNKQHLAQQIAAGIENFHATETLVSRLTKKAHDAQQEIQTLKKKLDTKKSFVDASEQALRYAGTHLEFQAQKDVDELTKFEIYAGLKIDVVKVDVLRFRFANVDAIEIDKEVFLDLDVGGNSYSVARTCPNLSADVVLGMERELNKSGIMVKFLQKMRKALKNAL